MLNTKIVATIGPASTDPQILGSMIDAGARVIRFNMSHGTLDEHQQRLDTVRRLVKDRELSVAILADLCGPKVRTGVMDKDRNEIRPGDTCTIVKHCEVGTADRFETNYPGLTDDVEIGHRLLIDDGTIRLKVEENTGKALTCKCEIGGTIGSRKGINVPDSMLSLPSLSNKDRKDLAWAVASGVDYVALSFVRHAEDIQLLRTALTELQSAVPIVAKIETPQAIASLDEIIDASDAILVARGDLGVEMDVSRIPMLQKDMVERCRLAGKPVIVATQMLHSMVHSAIPTRAEVSDVANAVLEGADAVMLSAESASGSYPVESVRMMARIIHQSHAYASAEGKRRSDRRMSWLHVGQPQDRTTSAVARSAAIVAHDLGAKLIVVWARSGTTARWISKYQMPQSIWALSDQPEVCRRLMLSYGIQTMPVPQEFAVRGIPWSQLQKRLARVAPLEDGDVVVLVGDPGSTERAPTLSIRVAGDAKSD